MYFDDVFLLVEFTLQMLYGTLISDELSRSLLTVGLWSENVEGGTPICFEDYGMPQCLPKPFGMKCYNICKKNHPNGTPDCWSPIVCRCSWPCGTADAASSPMLTPHY